jgi:hypothetical protein
MTINRRELRQQLGSRTSRRRGTKSKAIPGCTPGPNGYLQRYAATHHQVARVSVRVEASIRALAAAKQAG